MRWATWFVRSAGIILVLAAATKIASACGSAGLLDLPDPVLNIKFRHEFAIVGTVEALIGLICLISRHVKVQLWLIAWLATSFGAYRLGLFWIGVHYCKCFGTLPDVFKLSAPAANGITLGLLAYLLAGSYLGVFCSWRAHRQL